MRMALPGVSRLAKAWQGPPAWCAWRQPPPLPGHPFRSQNRALFICIEGMSPCSGPHMIFEACKLLHSEESKEFSRGLRMFASSREKTQMGDSIPCARAETHRKAKPQPPVLAFRLPLMPPKGELTFTSLSQAD